MKLRSLIVYVCVLAAMGLFYYFYEVRYVGRQNEQREAGTKVFDVDFNQVTEILYEADRVEYHLKKAEDGRWLMLAPMETQADEWTVDTFLRNALMAQKDRIFEEPVKDLAQFGLENPALSLTLIGPAGELAPKLSVGDKNPVGMLYYARQGDSNEVFTLDASLRHDLYQTLFDLRDKSLVMFPAEKIDRLAFSGQENVELKRRGIRRWDVSRPVEGPADDDLVQKILYSGLKGEALKFAPLDAGAESDFGFDAPRARLKVFSPDGPVAEVVLGRAEEADGDGAQAGNYWARTTERQGEALLISGLAAELLIVDYHQVRERHVLPGLDRRLPVALEVAWGDKAMRAEKVQEIWEVVSPADGISRDADIERFLMALEDLRFERAVDDQSAAAVGLDQAGLTVVLTMADDRKISLRAGAEPAEGDLRAVRTDSGPVYLANMDEIIKKLPAEVGRNE